MKKIAATILTLCLLAAAALSVVAAGGITLSLSRGEGRVGETVDLVLTARDNPGIIGLQLKVKYDNEKLKLISVTDGGILGKEIHHQEKMESPYVLSWENYVSETNFAEDGTLCTLRFQILSGETGEEIPVILSADEFGVMNYKLSDLPRTLEDGAVTVTGEAAFPLPWVILGGCALVWGLCLVLAIVKKNGRGAGTKKNKAEEDRA